MRRSSVRLDFRNCHSTFEFPSEFFIGNSAVVFQIFNFAGNFGSHDAIRRVIGKNIHHNLQRIFFFLRETFLIGNFFLQSLTKLFQARINEIRTHRIYRVKARFQLEIIFQFFSFINQFDIQDSTASFSHIGRNIFGSFEQFFLQFKIEKVKQFMWLNLQNKMCVT